jgi:hypothetical protein
MSNVYKHHIYLLRSFYKIVVHHCSQHPPLPHRRSAFLWFPVGNCFPISFRTLEPDVLLLRITGDLQQMQHNQTHIPSTPEVPTSVRKTFCTNKLLFLFLVSNRTLLWFCFSTEAMLVFSFPCAGSCADLLSLYRDYADLLSLYKASSYVFVSIVSEFLNSMFL